MKVVVIGCTHAGTAAIINTKKLHPQSEITVYERNDNISFLSCGIALHVGGVVQDQNSLFYCSPQKLADLGVKTAMQHDVTTVDFDKKEVTVKNLKTQEVFTDTYDKLVITTGSWPICPKHLACHGKGVLFCKNFDHSKEIVKQAQNAQNVVVIGAGYIGVELVEAFAMNGKTVTLIDSQDRIMSRYFDAEFTNKAEDALTQNGIKLALGETVSAITEVDGVVSAVVTDKNSYPADLVIMAIGFKANTSLFTGKLDMLANGAIIVDKYMQTSQNDVYAAGDCCSVFYNPTMKNDYIPLATNAVRMGTLVAHNLLQPTLASQGTQGTSAIKIYQYNIASTGQTATAANESGIEVNEVVIEENYRPEFMPTYDKVTFKLVYRRDNHQIVGAQLISCTDLTQSINTMSVVVQNKMTIEELAFTDLFFQPHYNKPWNFINQAALAALAQK